MRKYSQKLIAAGFAPADGPGAPLIGGLDDTLVWNREDERIPLFSKVFDALSINSFLFCRPAEPYRTAVEFLAERNPSLIVPDDTETRTFLHGLPVAEGLSSALLVEELGHNKCLIIPGHGVATYGTVSPEQAFVVFSSVCFSCFVKFFSDYLAALRRGGDDAPDDAYRKAFARAVSFLPDASEDVPQLMRGPFQDEEAVYAAIAEAGRKTVEFGLVDSYFGNVSYTADDIVYISQTGSSLDELEGCVDPCPLDGSSCAGLTASSELSAHTGVVLATGRQAILHGHPKFSVIMSMDCPLAIDGSCPNHGRCHVQCDKDRKAGQGEWAVPVVPGEVGTGPTGLCNTLPPAMKDNKGVIVWGHGLFTVGQNDFNEAFASLLHVENTCREEYFKKVQELGG